MSQAYRHLSGMSLDLPQPIAVYVAAENSGDVEALSQAFAPEATVRDENRTYNGLAAIKKWKAETKRKYNHTVTPLEIAVRHGETVLKARLTGNFPGSPIELQFVFVLEGDRIASLKIGPTA
jgi:hypothetical protein